MAEAHAGGERIQATRGQDYAFIYSTAGLPIQVRMGLISGKKVKASWFDPRTGYALSFGTFKNSGTREFVCPSQGRDNDWVLILDNARKRYALPKPRK